LEELKETYKKPFYDPDDLRVELPQNFKILCCPNCATEIPADNLNINENVGKCNSCSAVFSIDEEIKGLKKGPNKLKQEILRPAGIEMFQFQNQFEISVAQPMAWAEWPFLIIFFILFMGGIGASVESSSFYPFLIMTVIPSIINFLYYIRRKEKHRVILAIDDQHLDIMWRPKKLHHDKTYKVADISQLYTKYKADLGTWQIYMIIDEGEGQKHVKLTSVHSASQAKYLEQEMEAYLKIQDVHVPEEA